MKLCSAERCNSCMACYNACPFNAIYIKHNIFGAIQPIINQEECRKCGLCQQVCPEKTRPTFHYPLKAIALYTKNDFDKKTCASGGAATAFSRYVIAQGGCVFGATSVGGYPHFIKADNEEELELLKGSKYVYCEPKTIYREVKEELKTGKLCLFIGTPCNVSGLLAFLKKSYENLITIDLICHGSPPFSYLKDHIESKVGNYSKVGDFSFRGKHDFYLTVYDKNNNIIYKRNQYVDEYFMAFMQGFMFRPICYECQFAQNKRVSDITIGDFWNLGVGALNYYKGKVSVALLNTNKSINFFEKCYHYFYYEERTIQEAINGNDQLRHPSPKRKQRETFVDLYTKHQSVKWIFSKMGITVKSHKNKIHRYVLYIPRLIKHLLLSK